MEQLRFALNVYDAENVRYMHEVMYVFPRSAAIESRLRAGEAVAVADIPPESHSKVTIFQATRQKVDEAKMREELTKRVDRHLAERGLVRTPVKLSDFDALANAMSTDPRDVPTEVLCKCGRYTPSIPCKWCGWAPDGVREAMAGFIENRPAPAPPTSS